MPGCHADKDPSPTNPDDMLFLEEALREDDKTKLPLPFSNPVSTDEFGNLVPFLEPRSDDPRLWMQFNKWILGHSIPEKAAGEPRMTTLLRELASIVRIYNAELYRLRRLRFFYDTNGTGPQPPQNPHGLDEVLFDSTGPISTSSQKFANYVDAAEKAWNQITTRLNEFIDKPYVDLKIEALDLVEVNNYVVSIRVVAKPVGQGELVGSSSHVSISSAYSAYP